MRLARPALAVLNARDRPVRDLVIESLVDGDQPFGLGVDAVDRQVEVPVVGVAVERVDRLVVGEAERYAAFRSARAALAASGTVTL